MDLEAVVDTVSSERSSRIHWSADNWREHLFISTKQLRAQFTRTDPDLRAMAGYGMSRTSVDQLPGNELYVQTRQA